MDDIWQLMIRLHLNFYIVETKIYPVIMVSIALS